MVLRAQPVTSSARTSRSRNNADRSTQKLVNPKLETLEQLAKRYSHLEMGFGDGKYEINKQSTKLKRTAVKQTAKKSQVSSKANNYNNNNTISSSNNIECIDVDDEGDDDYMPNGTRGKRAQRQMAIPSANSLRRLDNKRRSSRPTPVKTMIASLPNNKTITTISKTTTTTTSRAKSTSYKEDKSDKPGTAGSKQALTAPKRGARPGSRRQNGLTSKTDAPSQELIDTNNWVDITIVQFPKELCQRARIEDVPDDPERLCKKFVIILSDLDVGNSETPPHASDDEQLSSWKARVSDTLN